MGKYTKEELMHLFEYSARALGALEEDIYEFTRCRRPNGSVYGTKGKCRKGSETMKKATETKEPRDFKYQDILPKEKLKVSPDPKVPFHKWWKENKSKIEYPVDKDFRASKAPLGGLGSEASGHSFKDIYHHTLNSLLFTYYRRKHERLQREN
jgi:hypothetical protein